MPRAKSTKHSAGLVIYRLTGKEPEVLLVHPGGPFWSRRDLGAWSIPKGEFIPGAEEPLAAAIREVGEETGCVVKPPFTELTPVRQKGGKTVHAWAVEGDCDPSGHQCNTYELEWPPRSGKFQTYPEVDQARWFALAQARRKILEAQGAFLDELEKILPT